MVQLSHPYMIAGIIFISLNENLCYPIVYAQLGAWMIAQL